MAKPKKICDRLVAALEALGEVRVQARTSKYLVYTRTRPVRANQLAPTQGTYYYIGRSGALRAGSSVADSLPVSATREWLLARSP
jgi:hypothetical protein